MSIVVLVEVITISSINDGGNNVVSIKIEISGFILLPRGLHCTITPDICFCKDVFDFYSRNLFRNVSYKSDHKTVPTALSRSWK
jgi:hypothetical protein